MRKLLLVAVLVLGAAGVQAQGKKGFEKPDYQQIERVTKDKGAATYYPKLLKRYQSNDTTLGLEDFRLLYYGFFFQDGFKSTGVTSAVNDSLKAIFKKKDITNADRKNAIKYTLEDMKAAPFSLRDIYRLYNLYQVLGDVKNTRKYEYKLEMISGVISGTGDGQSDSSGLHVLSVEDEYTIVSLLGYDFGGTQEMRGQCHYLTLAKNNDKIEGLYFDVSEIMVRYGKGKK